jgi:hypothetical protein
VTARWGGNLRQNRFAATERLQDLSHNKQLIRVGGR